MKKVPKPHSQSLNTREQRLRVFDHFMTMVDIIC